ncbi:MAG: PASTA domain-containing protein, partial [Planctomycetota bacterium]
REPVNTPNIIGMSQADARKTLDDAKLQLGPVSEITVPDAQVGLVISQSPFPNVVTQAGSSVECAIGKKGL